VNDDHRLNAYFRGRADRLAVPDRDPVSVTGTTAHRRSRRIMVATVAAAAIALLAATAALRPPTETTSTGSPGSTPLRWTVVDLPEGLGIAHDPVVADDGAVYALSTAPGSSDTQNPVGTLYRSADGRSWAPQALPDHLQATALSAGGSRIHAVGPDPAGGAVVVASSADGGSTWSSARIPMPRADLMLRHREVSVAATSLAAGPESVVVAVSVQARPDLHRLLEGKGLAGGLKVDLTDTGVSLSCPEQMPATVPPGTGPGPCTGADTRAYTWEELGLDPELRAIVNGETHLFRSTGGDPFAEVPAALPPGSVTALFSTATGYRLLLAADSPRTAQVRSTDGLTWERSGPDLAAGPFAVTKGLLGRQPAVVYYADQTDHVRLATADRAGVWTVGDLSLAVPGREGRPLFPGNPTFGPLGLAAVATPDDGKLLPDGHLVLSTDGRTVSATPLGPMAGDGPWIVSGLTVDADAVIVRLTRPDQGQPGSGGPSQRLLVGTPA
jgi:hypothetical protein